MKLNLSKQQVKSDGKQHHRFLNIGVAFYFFDYFKSGRVLDELNKFPCHPAGIQQQKKDRSFVQIPDKKYVGENIHPGQDKYKSG
jgi:hypothetical protein